MTLFADTPQWPAHGTVWGHLVSDTSLEELHAAAPRLGLPGRAFDLDLYDWPASAEQRLRDGGVQFVDGRELTRRLVASGLRVPLKDRPAARLARTDRDLAALGLERDLAVPVSEGSGAALAVPVVVEDLVWGPVGHADPLPDSSRTHLRVGSEADATRRIMASPDFVGGFDGGGVAPGALDPDALGRGVLGLLDAAARGAGEARFVGQCLVRVAGWV